MDHNYKHYLGNVISQEYLASEISEGSVLHMGNFVRAKGLHDISCPPASSKQAAAGYAISNDGRKAKISLPFQFQPKKEETSAILDHVAVITVDPPMYQLRGVWKRPDSQKPLRVPLRNTREIALCLQKYATEVHRLREKLNRHMRSHTGEKRFVCQKCNRGFTTSQALKTHTYIHTGERPFLCTKCPQQFTTLTNLKKHLVTHTGNKEFLCNYCGKSFFHKDSLDVHLTIHSSTPRPHICGQCGRAFGSMKDLNRHCRTHTGERPFQCSMCDLKCSRLDNLTRHIGNVHKHLKGKSKRLRIKAKSQSIESTAFQSSPIAEKRKINEKRWKKQEDALEESVQLEIMEGLMAGRTSTGTGRRTDNSKMQTRRKRRRHQSRSHLVQQRLQHSAASRPSAEIENDIQLKRGPRKHFVSRYYFIHQSVVQHFLRPRGENEQRREDDSTFNDDERPILITTDLLKAVENEKAGGVSSETRDTTTMTKAVLRNKNLIPEAHEQNESQRQFENNDTTIANEEETSAARFGSFHESASSQSTTVEAENQRSVAEL
ncbi:Zinc finger and BTB domain-containing protein 24 [Orchesella cincta]|uniref:Zinc finger and BTB domain-containing protein 24 n=1 Tax=Orchesella cincta TaxID=48709 RepID=A0A1D2MCG3_ORCCI|nr:Zinc finger and BTB domain-containing protein 24 [Orchesella cincta]